MRFARSAIAVVVAAAIALQGVASAEDTKPTKLTADFSEESEGNARFSLAAPFASNLALKVTYDLLYRNQPLPGLEKLDTTFGVGVQATF